MLLHSPKKFGGVLDPGKEIVEEITESGPQTDGDETGDGLVITVNDSRTNSVVALENNNETVSDTETAGETQTTPAGETDAVSDTVGAEEAEAPAGNISENTDGVVTDDNSDGEPTDADEDENKSDETAATPDEAVSEDTNTDSAETAEENESEEIVTDGSDEGETADLDESKGLGALFTMLRRTFYMRSADTVQDNPYITVSKTFSGITATQIPSDDFTITLSQEGRTKATLTLGNAYSVSQDGLTYTWKLDNLPAGTYTVAESGMGITGYDLSVTGIGADNATSGSVTTKASTLDLTSDPNKVPQCNKNDYAIGTLGVDFNFVVASTNDDGGGTYIVWTQDNLSSSQREALVTKLQSVSDLGNLKKITLTNSMWYSGDKLGNEISVRGATIQYKVINGVGNLHFSDPSQWSMFAYGNYGVRDSEGADIAVANSYTPITKTITVTKVWEDRNNQDGIRPDEVAFTVTGSDDKTYEVTLTAPVNDPTANTWTAEVEVEKYADGEEVTFTVDEETVNGYTKTINGLTITNTHAVEKDTITVTKVWEDRDNQDGIRPDEVTFTVTGSDDKTYEVTLSAPVNDSTANTWTADVEVEKYDDGEEVTFTVDEDEVPAGYEKSVDNDNLIVTNTHEVETKTITVTKVWEDRGNQDGIRPDEVTFTVTGSDDKTYEVTLSAPVDDPTANTWTVDVEVEKYADGEEVTFTVDENEVPGYEKSVDNDNLIVTNTHEVETKTITVTKVWDDKDDQDKIRPRSVKLTVTGSDGKKYDVDVTGTGNKWTDEVEVEKFADGEEVTFTVDEDEVPTNYEKSVDNETLTVTNKHAVPAKPAVPTSSVSTGLESNIWLYRTLGAVAIIGILTILMISKKEKQK